MNLYSHIDAAIERRDAEIRLEQERIKREQEESDRRILEKFRSSRVQNWTVEKSSDYWIG